ncbi:protein FAM170A-like [Bos javanicus]|uniref:protein FAM170A-like n=1 Tax=Bos javanicus TaxID=9906 RepID=UPI002AA66145|nr:protein FAM170A-like [Bos javanicus]XP_061278962.1 protein FAM170A-like [Bos javanicus]
MSREISKLHEYDLPSVYSLESNALNHEERDMSSESEYLSCDSSFYTPFFAESWKTQEDPPQPESFVMVPACSQIIGETSSASTGYFSCVSSERELVFSDEDGVQQSCQDVTCLGSTEMPPVLDLELGETSSPCPQVSSPFNLVHNNKPSSSVHTKKKRVMKIYYMHVQTKKRVASLQDTEEGLESPTKKIQMEEMTSPEKIHTTFTPSQVTTMELLADSESSLDTQAKDERERAESPPEPRALEECSRAKTPEWLAALDSGFQCMSCYRIFPSLEDLQKHVEHGISEGFSCYAFHLALAWLKRKRNRKGKNRRRRKKIKTATSGCHKEKHFGMKTYSCKDTDSHP